MPNGIDQEYIDTNGDDFADQYNRCSHLKAFLDLSGVQNKQENGAKSDERGGGNQADSIHDKRDPLDYP